MTDFDPVARASVNLHLMADEYPVDHPDAAALRSIADKLETDGAGNEHARRAAHALLGKPLPPPLDPLPQPGTVVLGAVAERLPVGSEVIRDDIRPEYHPERVHYPAPRGWQPPLAKDVPYRVKAIPAQRVSS